MAASELSNPADKWQNGPVPNSTPATEPPWLRIWLLGQFRVSVGDRVIDDAAWRLRKAKNLVKLLALAPGHALPREELMDRLWPDLAPEAAANNLRYALYIARRAIRSRWGAPETLLQMHGEHVALCPTSPIWVDVEAFEAAAAGARRTADPAAYHGAINRYTGDLLPEDRYEDWGTTRREALRTTVLTLLVEVAQLHETHSAYPEAIAALERVTAVEPTHEQAAVALMRLLARTGQRSRALHAYKQLQEALRRELDAEPDPISQRLYADILASSAVSEMAHLSSRATIGILQHNLPAPVTGFLGRERELAVLRDLITRTRLLTLTGTGGCGKTRLALALAADLVFAYPDGVFFVELSGLVDPALVLGAVATPLGIREESGRPLATTLAETLRPKRLLLVLDNCEHLVAEVAQCAAELLAACPGVQILATSREALRAPGELTWRVPSLALPDAPRPTTLEALRGVESVSLFLDRVHLRQPDFILTAENAQAVIDICRRLDGLPLAIELAAGKAPVLSVEQLAARLTDALDVLTGGTRTVVPRHQTLRSTLDWSFDLLALDEQRVLTRLAVFVGGWTLEAAEAVVAGDSAQGPIAQREVLDLLSQLIDKSLIHIDSGRPVPRYRLLEPVRQYLAERLRASEENALVRQRHATYYRAFAERARSELERRQQVEWFDLVEREHDNVRAVLAWLLECRDFEMMSKIGWELAAFWYTHGHFSEGRHWMHTVLTGRSRLSATARARALCVAAAMALGQADIHAVSALSEECLTLISDNNNQDIRATVLFLLGHCAMQQRRFARASECFEESLSLYRAIGDGWGITLALDGLGQVPLLLGDYERAVRAFEECLVLARAAGNKTHIGVSLTNFGRAALLKGDYQQAIRLHEESLEIFRELGYSIFIVLALQRIGWAAVLMGDSDKAYTALEESLALAEALHNPRYIALVLHTLALIRLVQGDDHHAAALLQRSVAISGELGVAELCIDCVEAMAAVAGLRGNAQQAAMLWGAVEDLREAAGIPATAGSDSFYEGFRTAARAWLGEPIWTAAREEGRAMTLNQAVEAARAALEPVARARSTDPQVLGASFVLAALTAREREVAELVARGLTNHQIAGELGIAQRTADTHVSHILHKLRLTTRSQVLWLVEHHGLLIRGDG